MARGRGSRVGVPLMQMVEPAWHLPKVGFFNNHWISIFLLSTMIMIGSKGGTDSVTSG
jgi:hypothetical protein